MKKITLRLLCILALIGASNVAASDPPRAEKLKTVEFLGMTSSLPASWVEEDPSSSMRLAQFSVPGSDADSNANLVIYYFGQGQGGTNEANISRWQSQFSKPDGGVVSPQVQTTEAQGMPVTLVEFRGDYARGVGMGIGGTALKDQMLLAAIVEYPRGNIFIQLHGPAEAVSMHRAAFIAFIQSIET
jgi:hypothetical protein